MNTIIYKTNATKGMALMNEVNGRRWVEDFDLESFDITLPEACVLGQFYDDFEAGLEELFGDSDEDVQNALSVYFGFDSDAGNFRQLQAEWTALISDQKAELEA